jgi:ribosome-binding protein aMBF1 (putative translation factor)
MSRTTMEAIKPRRLAAMSERERSEFDAVYSASRLAIEVGEQIRNARENAGLSQRELAARSSRVIQRLRSRWVARLVTSSSVSSSRIRSRATFSSADSRVEIPTCSPRSMRSCLRQL